MQGCSIAEISRRRFEINHRLLYAMIVALKSTLAEEEGLDLTSDCP